MGRKQRFISAVVTAMMSASFFTGYGSLSVNADENNYQEIRVDGSTVNNNSADTFKGFGTVTANNSSRLLLDYKEENPDEYWNIMNYLFKENYGAGLTHIKVELGSDVNSSSGTEPASMRSEDEEADVTRGAGWVFAADAKKINPNITVDALRWSEPKWVTEAFNEGNEAGYSARYKWYKDTVDAVYETYGLKLDYISVDQNERDGKEIDTEWIKFFVERFKVDTEATYDYSSIKFVSSDEVGSRKIAEHMLADQELCDAIDVIGIHYTTYSDANMKKLNEMGKEIWYSEGASPTTQAKYGVTVNNSGLTGPNSALDIANRFINSYYNGSMVMYEYQPAVAAYYEGAKYYPKQLISAYDPWSGYYETDVGIWMTAHFMQFADTGWQYIDSACYGDGDEATAITNTTNNYLTLKDPATDDYSMIVTNDSDTERAYRIVIDNLDTKANDLYVWESRGPDDGEEYDDNWFNNIGTLTPVKQSDGSYYVEMVVEAYSIVTLTTTTGQSKGEANEKALARDLLALPYYDDFEYSDYDENYLARRGNAPRYTTDQGGAFEVEEGSDNNTLKQIIAEDIKPNDWRYRYTPNPYTMLGDNRWSNYTASIDILLDTESNGSGDNYVALGGRHITTTYSDNWADSGYSIKLYEDGTWELMHIEKIVDTGSIENFDSTVWHNLKLKLCENEITAFIDENEVSSYVEEGSLSATGKVSLASGYYNTQYDNLKVEPIEGYAIGAIERLDDLDSRLIYSGNWDNQLNTGYGDYNRTQSVASSATMIAHNNTTDNEGEVGKFYYYKPSGAAWGSNGSNAWSQDEGSFFELTFQGNGFTLYGDCNSSNGIGELYVDGELVQEINYGANNNRVQAVANIAGLEDGIHTLKVLHKAGTYISCAGASINSVMEEAATLSYNFVGTGFNIAGGSKSAMLDVYIDDNIIETNYTTPETRDRETSYYCSGLEYGNHTLKVVVKDGTYTVDAVEILGEKYQVTIEPEVPVEPENPEKPVNPEEPVKPEEPVVPSAPEEPSNPESPVNPEVTEKPVTPEQTGNQNSNKKPASNTTSNSSSSTSKLPLTGNELAMLLMITGAAAIKIGNNIRKK